MRMQLLQLELQGWIGIKLTDQCYNYLKLIQSPSIHLWQTMIVNQEGDDEERKMEEIAVLLKIVGPFNKWEIVHDCMRCDVQSWVHNMNGQISCSMNENVSRWERSDCSWA